MQDRTTTPPPEPEPEQMRATELKHPGWIVTVYGGGTALQVEKDGSAVFLQGDEAALAYDEYCDLMEEHTTPGTRASRFSEAELMDEMFGGYFE